MKRRGRRALSKSDSYTRLLIDRWKYLGNCKTNTKGNQRAFAGENNTLETIQNEKDHGGLDVYRKPKLTHADSAETQPYRENNFRKIEDKSGRLGIKNMWTKLQKCWWQIKE